MSLKLVKKWMIIPYQEENPEREKIQRILSNKTINNNEKLKYINNIIISKNQIKNDIFGKDQETSPEDKDSCAVYQGFDSRVRPGGNRTMQTLRDEKVTPTQISNEEQILDPPAISDDSSLEISSLKEKPSHIDKQNDNNEQQNDEDFEFKDLDRTFKNLYDYLPPSEQTRSKSDVNRSYLTLSKQKKRTKHRPLPPDKLKGK
jgi:predicted small secreted protein